jgi:hypothetical protein
MSACYGDQGADPQGSGMSLEGGVTLPAFGDTSGPGFGDARSGIVAGAARVQLYGSAGGDPGPDLHADPG